MPDDRTADGSARSGIGASLLDRLLGSLDTADRGASEVVAVTLLIAVVMLGISSVLLIGGPQLLTSQEEVEIRQAERAMTQFDSSADRIIRGSSTTQEVDLGLRGHRGALDVEPEQGNITVNFVDSFEDGGDVEVLNAELGTIRYENGDTTVAYQGGGVWRSDGGNATMVSPPVITLTDRTLKVPVVTLADDGSVHTDLQLSQAQEPIQHYPDQRERFENKVGPAMIHIIVESDYYEAWGQYFEDETGAVVQYDHEDKKVAVILTGHPLDYSPEAGVITTSSTGEVRLEGTGAYVDSYNSTNGTYAETQTSEGIVKSAGSVDMRGNSHIAGHVDADQDIVIGSDDARIEKDAEAGDRVFPADEESVGGEIVNNTAGVVSIPPMDAFISPRVASLEAENDNAQTDVITDDGELNFTEGTETLDTGEYYLTEAELEDQTLVLDTTEGDITLGVENWITLRGSGGSTDAGVIEVKGPNTVQVYVNGSTGHSVNPTGMGTRDLHFYVEEDAAIKTVDDEVETSTQFQVLGPSWFEGAVAGSRGEGKNASMTGMIIAPAGPLGDGYFNVKHANVYGSVLAGNITLGQYGQVHFDHAIKDLTIPVGEQVPRVEYMYVTEHQLEVKESD